MPDGQFQQMGRATPAESRKLGARLAPVLVLPIVQPESPLAIAMERSKQVSIS
jgi:hypothetical protein